MSTIKNDPLVSRPIFLMQDKQPTEVSQTIGSCPFAHVERVPPDKSDEPQV